MACVPAEATAFDAIVSGDRVVIEVTPALSFGHRLRLERESMARGVIDLQILDCNDEAGDSRFAAIDLPGVRAGWIAHLHYAGGVLTVPIREGAPSCRGTAWIPLSRGAGRRATDGWRRLRDVV